LYKWTHETKTTASEPLPANNRTLWRGAVVFFDPSSELNTRERSRLAQG